MRTLTVAGEVVCASLVVGSWLLLVWLAVESLLLEG